MPKKTAPKRGGFVSEWFGHRMYPEVVSGANSIGDQQTERCPFLSDNKGITTPCVKSANSRGVCTINFPISGERKDWLVCPYRAMTPGLLENATRVLFSLADDAKYVIKPAVSLKDEAVREEIRSALASGQSVFTYFDKQLGGELSISGTESSPEFSFDVTLVEIRATPNGLSVGRFGILELQTMDFHGSYRTAVRNLTENLRMFAPRFGETIRENQHLLGEDIEGPNIANVFKRTFYQMMFKFQLGLHEQCAGCILAIPRSVWLSWLPHLGGAPLTRLDGNRYELRHPGNGVDLKLAPAWIFIFDTDHASPLTPAPLAITHEVATDIEALSYYALEVAPQNALATINAPRGIIAALDRRFRTFWPELGRRLEATDAQQLRLDKSGPPAAVT